jgi:GGDEF domain-containing protein
MRRFTFTPVQKVAAGYLTLVLFTLVAIGYALASLHSQTTRSKQMVSVDFKALTLQRQLRRNLLGLETLEKQLVILRDPSLLDLFDRRQRDLRKYWDEFDQLPPATRLAWLTPMMRGYLRLSGHGRALLQQRKWRQASAFFAKRVTPLRNRLDSALSELEGTQEKILNDSLGALTEDSSRAYRVTSLLALIGILLSAPAAITVIFSIHRSVGALTRATREIASGSFDYQTGIQRQDEFGRLSQAFAEMGQKLHDLEQLRLDANPLTHLPGNLVIDREIDDRITQERPFAHLYIDLDNFKAYGDRYGYLAGSEVLARIGEIAGQVTRAHGNAEDLVGHIGGDDYVILTTPEQAESIAKALVEEFDKIVPGFYSEEDLARGFFIAQDRFGVERKFPLLTMSVAIIHSENFQTLSPAAISRECAKIKKHLKELPGSNYMVDRRKEI